MLWTYRGGLFCVLYSAVFVLLSPGLSLPQPAACPADNAWNFNGRIAPNLCRSKALSTLFLIRNRLFAIDETRN